LCCIADHYLSILSFFFFAQKQWSALQHNGQRKKKD
jgi:hypothetical protein